MKTEILSPVFPPLHNFLFTSLIFDYLAFSRETWCQATNFSWLSACYTAAPVGWPQLQANG